MRAWSYRTRPSGVAGFHRNTLRALAELIAAAGLTHPSQLRPHHIVQRVSHNDVRLLSHLLPFLKPGELLDGVRTEHFPHKVYENLVAKGQGGEFSGCWLGLGRIKASWRRLKALEAPVRGVRRSPGSTAPFEVSRRSLHATMRNARPHHS